MITMTPSFSDPKAIVDAGERIYSEKYQKEYEERYAGRFVAIDVVTGKAYIGETAAKALEDASQSSDGGPFHLIKVGSPGAFRVGYAHAAVDWLFQ